jgi:hypothetical protein
MSTPRDRAACPASVSSEPAGRAVDQPLAEPVLQPLQRRETVGCFRLSRSAASVTLRGFGQHHEGAQQVPVSSRARRSGGGEGHHFIIDIIYTGNSIIYLINAANRIMQQKRRGALDDGRSP